MDQVIKNQEKISMSPDFEITDVTIASLMVSVPS
jgi:hypothetical protein